MFPRDKPESSMSLLAVSTKAVQAPTIELQDQDTQIGIRRNRMLTRQPRVKRDSDSLSTAHASPEISTGFEFDSINSSNYAKSSSEIQRYHHLLTVPQRIERHSSEPAQSSTTPSPHFLPVPQSTPFLTKQLSDPLLPSQQAALSASLSSGSHFVTLHRQYSHPLPSSHITSTPLHYSHGISLPESIYTSGSPQTGSSSQYFMAQQPHRTSPSPTIALNKSCADLAETSTMNPISQLPQLTTTFVSIQSNSPPFLSSASDRKIATPSLSENSLNTKPTALKSISGALLSERVSLHPDVIIESSGQVVTSSSFEHLPTLRIKTEELQRSVSSPQTTREIVTLENPRSSHCPVIRPGPALGCNFCWNTIDGHGRILRRKTKYHCPECQTNLCIVPCFQEYHEKLNNETLLASSSSNDHISSKASLSTSASASFGSTITKNSTRSHNKTESI